MKNWLKRKIEAKTGDPAFEAERLLLDLTEQLVARLSDRKMRRSRLAATMGVDRAVVTRLLSGDHNATLRTLVSVAAALDSRMRITIEDLQPSSTSHIERTTEQKVPADMAAKFHDWLNRCPTAADMEVALAADRGATHTDSWTSVPM